MKKNFFAAFVAMLVCVLSVVMFSSCDSTYLGEDDETSSKVPVQPTEPGEVVTFENAGIVVSFETSTGLLQSRDYTVYGDYVTRKGSTVTNTRSIYQDLELNVKFSELSDIYVATPAELEIASVKGTNKGKVSETSVNSAKNGGKVVSASTPYAFTFDQNEVVNAIAMEQRLELGDTIFPRAIIRSLSFKEAKSVKDETLCNEDSLVYNVTLFFNVDIEIDREVRSRSVDANVETYVVPVEERRIYKFGEKPAVDEYVKTIVLNWSENLNKTNREFSVTTAEIWSVSGQKNELTENFSVPFGISAPSAQTIYSDNAKYQTTSNGVSVKGTKDSKSGNWSVTTRTQNYTSTASNGLNPFNNVYTVNDAKVVYTRNEATVEFPYGNWTISEGNSSITGPTANGNYEVYSYVNNIDYVYAITSDSSRGNAKAEASIYVKKAAQDEITTNLVSSSDKIEGDNRVITVITQKVGTVSGKQDPVTETIKLPIVWNNPTMQSIYTGNLNYTTRSNGQKSGNESSRKEGNFTVVTRTSSYSSTANNGDKAFNNNYTMSDSKVTYSKDGINLTFGYGAWNIEEGQSTVGNSVAEGDYNVSVYTNNVNYVYSLTNGSSKNGKGVSQAKLYVAKPAEKIIPENWGKIVGAGISAVPSDDLGEGTNVAKKCLTIRTTKGAVAVVFDWNGEICSVNNILNGYFVEGNFDANYNSGYYTTNQNKGSYATGKWAPAKAQDLSNRIAYYSGSTCVRNVPFSTLKMWGWANGESTKVNGYTFKVSDNGTLTVSYNGKTVMSIR